MRVGAVLKVAVTAVAEVPTLTVQVPVPLQPPPLQPAKTEATEFGVAVRTTDDPLSKLAVQVVPQLMPTGELVTLPLPAPARVTVMGKVALTNCALTDCAAVIVTVQVPTPPHPPPLHPANTEAADVGVAVRVTVAPEV